MGRITIGKSPTYKRGGSNNSSKNSEPKRITVGKSPVQESITPVAKIGQPEKGWLVQDKSGKVTNASSNLRQYMGRNLSTSEAKQITGSAKLKPDVILYRSFGYDRYKSSGKETAGQIITQWRSMNKPTSEKLQARATNVSLAQERISQSQVVRPSDTQSQVVRPSDTQTRKIFGGGSISRADTGLRFKIAKGESRIKDYISKNEGTIAGIGTGTLYMGGKFAFSYGKGIVNVFRPSTYKEFYHTITHPKESYQTMAALGGEIRQDPSLLMEIGGEGTGFGKGPQIAMRGVVKAGKISSRQIISAKGKFQSYKFTKKYAGQMVNYGDMNRDLAKISTDLSVELRGRYVKGIESAEVSGSMAERTGMIRRTKITLSEPQPIPSKQSPYRYVRFDGVEKIRIDYGSRATIKGTSKLPVRPTELTKPTGGIFRSTQPKTTIIPKEDFFKSLRKGTYISSSAKGFKTTKVSPKVNEVQISEQYYGFKGTKGPVTKFRDIKGRLRPFDPIDTVGPGQNIPGPKSPKKTVIVAERISGGLKSQISGTDIQRYNTRNLVGRRIYYFDSAYIKPKPKFTDEWVMVSKLKSASTGTFATPYGTMKVTKKTKIDTSKPVSINPQGVKIKDNLGRIQIQKLQQPKQKVSSGTFQKTKQKQEISSSLKSGVKFDRTFKREQGLTMNQVLGRESIQRSRQKRKQRTGLIYADLSDSGTASMPIVGQKPKQIIAQLPNQKPIQSPKQILIQKPAQSPKSIPKQLPNSDFYSPPGYRFPIPPGPGGPERRGKSSPILPPPPPLVSLNIGGGSSFSKKAFKSSSFMPKYFASVEAVSLGVSSKGSKSPFSSGLDIRPIKI